MKLLFDQNLSPRLAMRLADIFPGSSHVFWLGLDRAADEVVWEYARAEGYLLVTKDVDFSELSTLRGFPPKVIWLRLGNCTATQIEALLRRHFDAVQNLADDDAIGILTLR